MGDEDHIRESDFSKAKNVSDEDHHAENKTKHDVTEDEHEIQKSEALSSKSGCGG